MHLNIIHYILICSIPAIFLIWRFYHLPIDRLIRSAKEVDITRPLDIMISSWFGRSSFSFQLCPRKSSSEEKILSQLETFPVAAKSTPNGKCDLCHEYLEIAPPRFGGQLLVREARYMYLQREGGAWERYEKVLINAPAEGRIFRSVKPEHGHTHWWLDVVTPGELLFTIIAPDSTEHEVRADDIYNVYSFQVESGNDKSPAMVLADDVVMVLVREAPEHTAR